MDQDIRGVNNYTNVSGTRNNIGDYAVPFNIIFESEGVVSGLNVSQTDPVSPAVAITPGYAVINCGDNGLLTFELADDISDLEVPNTGTAKYYLVVLKVDITNATSEFVVVEGTAGTDPNLVEGGSPEVYYLVIARINKLATANVTNAEILQDGTTLTNNSTPEIIHRKTDIAFSNEDISFKEWYIVDFAAADGVTKQDYTLNGDDDDHEVIQQAFDDATANDMKVFVRARGQIRFSSTVYYDNDLTCRGNGEETEFYLVSGSNCEMITDRNYATTGNTGAVFENFTLNGNRDGQTAFTGGLINTIASSSGSNIRTRNTFRRLWVKNSFFKGIYAQNSSLNTVEFCQVWNCGANGIDGFLSNENTIAFNEVHDITSFVAIVLNRRSTDNKIIYNTIYNIGDDGIQLRGYSAQLPVASILWQSGNTVRYTFEGSVSTSSFSSLAVGDEFNARSSTNALNDGIFYVTAVNTGSKYVEVINPDRSDNTLDEATSPAVASGNPERTSGNLIHGNTIKNVGILNGGQGILMNEFGCVNNTATGNYIEKARVNGIEVGAWASEQTLEGNTVTEAGSSAQITGTGTMTSVSAAVTGVGTLFTRQLIVGATIIVAGQTRTVSIVTDDTHLTVSVAFSPNVSAASFTFLNTPDALGEGHGINVNGNGFQSIVALNRTIRSWRCGINTGPDCVIKGNQSRDNGLKGSGSTYGIQHGANCTVEGNRTFETRTGANRTQTYGIVSGEDDSIIDKNFTDNNITAGYLESGSNKYFWDDQTNTAKGKSNNLNFASALDARGFNVNGIKLQAVAAGGGLGGYWTRETNDVFAGYWNRQAANTVDVGVFYVRNNATSTETQVGGVTGDITSRFYWQYLKAIVAVETDLVSERTSAAGVTIDGILVKDSGIHNLVDPVSAQDAATKAYVDLYIQGFDQKLSCRVATTANITLSGAQTIDGVSVIAGDRVLVKDQTSGAENGIYVCASGAWSRATDANTSAEVTSGMYVFVSEGTANGTNGFSLITNDPIVLDTTVLVFTQTTGAGQITAGDGLTKTGNILSVNVDNSSIEISTDALRVKALGITNGMLAGSIAVDKLVALTVSRAVATDASGYLTVVATTSTELGYVNGVTSAIQTQLNTKAALAGAAFTGQISVTGSSDQVQCIVQGFSTQTNFLQAWRNSGGTDVAAIANNGGITITAIKTARATKTANYTLNSADYTILVNAAGGNITITLPTSVGVNGRHYEIKRIDSSINTVTVDTTSSQTIDGVTTQSLLITSGSQGIIVVSDNANWFITARS